MLSSNDVTKSVVPCNRVKYTRADTDVLQKVFSDDLCAISSDGKEYMCKTCDNPEKGNPA